MPASSASPRARATSMARIAIVGGGLVATSLVSAPATTASGSVSGAPATSAAAGPTVTRTEIAAVGTGSSKAATAAERATAAAGLEAPAGNRLLAYTKADTIAGFAMYGVTWDSESKAVDLSVEIRTQTDGVWSEWGELDTDLDGGPTTAAEDDSVRDGTEPAWVGAASGIEVAVYGKGAVPTGLAVSTIDPGPDPAPASGGVTGTAAKTDDTDDFMHTPRIITRRGWGADPSLGDTCWSPRIGKTFKAVVIHHTAGSNDYTRRESKALVRGIYAYHTQSRGWCDIGYNFLVDRFGQIFEGRAGGIRRAVRGAHAGDYNVDTTGISLMGNFDVEKPPAKMRTAVVRLTAWRLGTAYHGAYGKPFVFDHRISRISGHRDVMATACPGRYVYDWLPILRARVEKRIGTYESRIERYWRSPAGKKHDLGPVRIGEQIDSRGRYTLFQRGAIYASSVGRYVIERGPLLKRYRALGQTESYLRYPKSGVAKAGASGSQIEFQRGRIYWSKGTGARDLNRGAVLGKYRQLDGPSGRLGFPTRSISRSGTVAVGRFQNGTITYDAATKKITVDYR